MMGEFNRIDAKYILYFALYIFPLYPNNIGKFFNNFKAVNSKRYSKHFTGLVLREIPVNSQRVLPAEPGYGTMLGKKLNIVKTNVA